MRDISGGRRKPARLGGGGALDAPCGTAPLDVPCRVGQLRDHRAPAPRQGGPADEVQRERGDDERLPPGRVGMGGPRPSPRRRAGRGAGGAGHGTPPVRVCPLDRPGPGGGEPLPLLPRFPGRQGGGELPGVRYPDRALGGGRGVPRLGCRPPDRADPLYRLLLHDPGPREGCGCRGRLGGVPHHGDSGDGASDLL